MKYLLSSVILFLTLGLIAQSNQRTRSEFDTDLENINARARLDFGKFKADLAVRYNVAEKKLELMRSELQMTAGDMYMALEVGKISKRSLDDVLGVYKNSNGQGWGHIAQQMGIKPGSPEFHQLKANLKGEKSKGKGKGGPPEGKRKGNN